MITNFIYVGSHFQVPRGDAYGTLSKPQRMSLARYAFPRRAWERETTNY